MIEIQGYNSKEEFINELPTQIASVFNIRYNVKERLEGILNRFIDNIFIIVEYPYVDKYYRDTYYNFFSKKHTVHQRDSVRVSFFYNNIQVGDFVNGEKIKDIQKAFLGILTIRPTSFSIIGHTFLSPKILKDNSFVCCLCKERVSIGGIEMSLYGFPFCSQDNESITCAESVLLMMADYYSNKFSDYSRLLPSEINETLKNLSAERQLPSTGLDTGDISFVLKDLGLGTKIYEKNVNDKGLFKQILYIYIESGIPVILVLDNNQGKRHVVVAIGREKVKNNVMANKKFTKEKQAHFSDIFDKILVMNDNCTPFELVDYESPCNYDTTYKISSFIVPLYNKVYSDAPLFLDHFKAIIDEFSKEENAAKVLYSKDQQLITRYFLTTSRSYKNYVVASKEFTPEFKAIFVDQSMPKFIWVAEIIKGTRLEEENQKVNTVVILDATESGFSGNLIIAFNSKNIVLTKFSDGKKLYSVVEMNIGNFNTFNNNLKGNHTLWQSQNY